jgi:hypothetical protein
LTAISNSLACGRSLPNRRNAIDLFAMPEADNSGLHC